MTADFDQPHIGLVVEGTGDRSAIPMLLRKFLYAREEYRELLGKPIPLKGVGNATKLNGIEGYVAAAAARPGCRGLLVVLDADDDCVVQRASDLAERIKSQVPQPAVVALAEKNYEDWLYASIETLEIGDTSYQPGANGLHVIKNALKESHGESYSKALWQPRLTDRLDISLATERSNSLARMFDRFGDLLGSIDNV